jgi:hypothetical protein
VPKIVKEEIQQARICQADLPGRDENTRKKGPCTETLVKTRHIEEKSTSGVVCPPQQETSGVVCPPKKGRADAGNNPTSARPFFQFLLLVLE